MTSTAERATALLALHADPALLKVVNVWDVASARVVAATAGTAALATASHAIAASYGYEDGEHIPRDLMLETVGRIAADVDLPVTADLEGGYGDAAETCRRAIGLGVVGANIEDQLRPLAEAAGIVESVMRAAAAEGVPDFVLNARTDAFLLAGDRDPTESLADAIERGKAFLDAGAPVVFVPGGLDEQKVDGAGRGLRSAAADDDPRAGSRAITRTPGGAGRGAGELRADPATGGPDRPAADGGGRRARRGRPGRRPQPPLSRGRVSSVVRTGSG